jgi:hypothetical protein
LNPGPPEYKKKSATHHTMMFGLKHINVWQKEYKLSEQAEKGDIIGLLQLPLLTTSDNWVHYIEIASTPNEGSIL